AFHQTLVGVGGSVTESVQSFSVLDDTADVVQSFFGQVGVTVACEYVLAIFGDGLVDVHAGTVVTYQRLGHEGSGFAKSSCHVVHYVFQGLNFVGFLHQGVEGNADFALASVGNFVVMNFNFQAHVHHGGAHDGADIVKGVDRRNREVAAFNARGEAFRAVFFILVGGPGSFLGDDLRHAVAHGVAVLHIVEDEEFRLWAEVSGITDAGGFQVFL